MRQYLVVANQTLGSERLAAKLAACLTAGPCRFHVLVPATHARHELVWTEGSDRVKAAGRLRDALERIGALGVDVDGEVGDANPVDAIRDVLLRDRFDEVILVTFPPGISRWLRQDLPHRVERAFGIPVTHLVAPAPVLRRAS